MLSDDGRSISRNVPHLNILAHDVINLLYYVLMTAYELKNIAILNAKGVNFSGILWGINRDEAVHRLNYCVRRKRCLINGFWCK